jgi:hypothetical protein
MDIINLIPKDDTINRLQKFFEDDKIFNIYKKKLIIYKFKNNKTNTNIEQKGGKIDINVIIDNDLRLKRVYSLYFIQESGIAIPRDKIYYYVLNKYNFKNNYLTLGIGNVNNNIFDFKNIKYDYYNSLPLEKKYNKISLCILLNYNIVSLKENFVNIEKYVVNILDKYLEENGTMIIYQQILLTHDFHINYLKKIFRCFEIAHCVFTKNFFFYTPFMFLILKKKKEKKTYLDTDFDKNIREFSSELNEFYDKNNKLTINTLELYLNSKDVYNLFKNKLKYVLQY